MSKKDDDKKVKVVVNHLKLYMKASNGKLQHVEQGTEITVTQKQADSLGSKVVSVGDYKRLVVTQAGLVDGDDKASIEAINQLSNEVELLKAENTELKNLVEKGNQKPTE